MIKKTISYVDYNDQEQSEVAYFHLSKQELGNLQMKMNGHYLDHIQALAEKRQIQGLYEFVYNLILDSYGEKDVEGRTFKKSPEMRRAFEQSIPFGEFLYELIQDGDKLAQFIEDVMPKGITAASSTKVVPVNAELVEGGVKNAAPKPSAN